MRGLPIFLPVLILIVASCSSSSDNSASERTPFVEEDDRFQACYHTDNLAQKTCDAIVRDFFGSEIFKQHIQLDKSESFINCQVGDNIEMKPFGDTLCCLPNTYDMVYTIREKGQKIYEFRMVSGSDMDFEHISTQSQTQLWAYKKLLAGAFPVGYSKARVLALKNGCSEDMFLELVYDEKGKVDDVTSYYWEIENALSQDRSILIQIDPFSGKISRDELMVRAGD